MSFFNRRLLIPFTTLPPGPPLTPDDLLTLAKALAVIVGVGIAIYIVANVPPLVALEAIVEIAAEYLSE